MMPKLTRQEILDAFAGMSVLELAEFTDAFEREFGVTVAAMAPGAPRVEEEQAPEEDEQAEFDVVLQAAGDKKIQVIKEVRAIAGLGLKEAKDLVEAAPKAVATGIPRDQAEAALARLRESGATAELR